MPFHSRDEINQRISRALSDPQRRATGDVDRELLLAILGVLLDIRDMWSQAFGKIERVQRA
jgi:hypothetical protein